MLDRVADDAKALARKAGLGRPADARAIFVGRSRNRKTACQHPGDRHRPQANSVRRPEIPSNLNDQVESMIDLIALAPWTDSTRCVTYMLGNSNSRMVFDFLGIQEQHHYLSHFFRNFSRGNLDALLKISLWHMEKFDSLLTRLKSYKDQQGSLLDHTVVLYGSGMGHSDNHTATRIPIILAGGQPLLKTGRYVRYSQNQELGRLHLSLLEKFGVDVESFAGATTPLPGLDGSDFEPYRERPFESWVKVDGDQITVQGRIRMSDNLDEARIFFVDVEGQLPIRVEVEFRDFHQFNLAYHCGTGITLTGIGKTLGDQKIITKVTELKSIYGKQPGTQNG